MKLKHPNGRFLSSKVFFIALIVGLFIPIAAEARTIAFLGDSITTGAVTHPELTFDKTKLWRMFRGEIPYGPEAAYVRTAIGKDWTELPRPHRLWPSVREYVSPSAFASRHLVNALSTVYLDTEEYSWSYILSRELGYKPDEIMIAAQDGARIEDGIAQLDRVLERTNGELPDELYIFFTGNDLCGPSIEMTSSAEAYAAELSNLLSYMLRNGRRTEAAPTRVFVLGFLGIMQITTQPEILNKTVPVHDGTASCRDLATVRPDENAKKEDFLEKHPEAAWFMSMFPSSPAAMCPTVFGTNPDRVDGQKGQLANRIRLIRTGAQAVVDKYQKIVGIDANKPRVEVSYIDGTGELIFEAKDIANDCFHLSLVGQNKVAESVRASRLKLP